MGKSQNRNYLVRLFDKQNGACCYCDGQAWLRSRETAAQAALRLGIPWGADGFHKMLTAAEATREHIKRRADGGTNSGNLKMACQACNTMRHESPSDVHRIDMQVLVAAGLHPTNRPRVLDTPREHIKAGLRALKKLRAGTPPNQGTER